MPTKEEVAAAKAYGDECARLAGRAKVPEAIIRGMLEVAERVRSAEDAKAWAGFSEATLAEFAEMENGEAR